MKKLCVVLSLMLIILSLPACSAIPQNNDSDNSTALDGINDDTKNSYEYTIEDGTATIISHQYNPEENEIVIPEKIEGSIVTAITKDAFYQHKNTISIVLPSSLERIDGSPFYRCYSLKSSFVPQNVKTISGNPYFRCSSLETITVDTKNPYFCDDNGILFNKDKTTLIAYPEGKTDESYTIPKTVTRIEGDSFGYHTGIKKLYIFSNVTELPDYNMFVYPQDIKIYVEAGSAAEEYVKKFDFNFEIIS